MKWGKLCASCKTTCVDPPTPQCPAEFSAAGGWELRECPASFCGEVRSVLRMADLAEKGCWPASGGTLDQTQWCAEAFEFIWNQEAAYKPPSLSL